MATVSKVRHLINPGRRRNKGKRRRNLSPLQKLFFGSKRQRAAVKANKGKRKSYKRRRKNVSSIVVVRRNPSRKRRRVYKRRRAVATNPKRRRRRNRSKVVINKGAKMAVRRRRRNRAVKANPRRRRNYGRRRTYRRRRNAGTKFGRSWSNYSTKRRKRNPGMRRRRHYNRGRRRNPGLPSGFMGRILGVIGGSALTSVIMGFVPASFGVSSGPLGYLTAAVVAFAQGKLVTMASKNSQLGEDFMVGGFAYVTVQIINNFFPSLSGYTGLAGMRGMGLLGGSSFYVPQVNQNGSMGSFQVPAAVMGAMPMAPAVPASANLGRLRRTGRLM